jgi:AbrB family looped-hinge helix DNA binding protein
MTSRVGPKGQVVIPKDMRDRLGIRPGDQVAFSLADGGVLVERVDEQPALKGRFEGSGMLAALESDHAHEVARER